MITILDCYTDEPSGLGVPPYLGTYPRYIAGMLKEKGESYNYITIDDLRLLKKHDSKKQETKLSQKTDISVYNLTKNYKDIENILKNTSELIIIAGIHTPGKYLSAIPGTLKEIIRLTKDIDCKKTITGPAVFGTSSQGGKFFEKVDLSGYNIKNYDFSYEEIKDYSIEGADIISQIPDLRIAEIETSKGCSRKKHCSFCTEPIKNRLSFRKKQDILKETKALAKFGVKDFRLGKQADYYSHPESIEIIKEIREDINPRTLHIDNVNPVNVITEKGIEITKSIVKYCTEGNIASFGVESFDPKVIEDNDLNSDPDTTYKAIKIINKYGKETGNNGMQKFLPGINLLFGLISESKRTHEHNITWLERFLKENLLLRRINIRQVDIFENTPIYNSVGNKFLKKNKKYYWKWRNEIRQKVDFPMLKKLVPKDTILKDVRTEIYDGKTTFARQLGTYPLIIGIKKRIELNKFISIKVTNHMLRSIVGEEV